MTYKRQLSRRTFLGLSAGLSAPLFIPASVLAAPGPNDRVMLGLIGVGRRGQQLIGEVTEDGQIVAIADVNQHRMEYIVSKQPKWSAYPDYRKMLERKDIDGVIIASTDHWHALNAIHACMAGKDVYCEKPISLTIHEGRVMVKAARKYKRVFQTGSQQRSSEANRFGCELVRNRRMGRIMMIHGHNYPSPWKQKFDAQPIPEGLDWELWHGPVPVREYNENIYLPRANPGWVSLHPYSGGEMTSWGPHGLDQIQWAMGMDESGPVEIWPEGEGLECPIGFRYADGTEGKLDDHASAGGALFVCENGTILIDRDVCEPKPKKFASPITESEIHLSVSDNHIQNWFDCIRSRERPVADVEIGHRSATFCHLGNIVRWTGRKLKWNPVKEEFIGDAEANALRSRPRRAPYDLPKI